MDERCVDAVREHGHDLDDRLDEVGPALSVPAGGQLDADLELGDGHRGHGDVVVIADPSVELVVVSFDVDEWASPR